MRKRRSSSARRAAAVCPLPAALLLCAACRAHLDWAAALTRVYVPCWRLLGRLSACFPVPLCWVLGGAFAVFLAASVCVGRFFRAVAALLIALAVFIGGWGVSCRNAPLAAQISGRRVTLEQLCVSLAQDAAANASATPDDATIFAAVPDVMDAAAQRLGVPAGGFAAPRASKIPGVLSRLLTEGVFIPFTGEALVNEALPACCLPYVACHEAAHARGVTREDDANLMAYLACSASEEAYFRFSGAVCALSFALEDLRRTDTAAYERVCGMLSEETREALCARSAFWEPYVRTRTAAAATGINEGYLAAVGAQPDGTAAYGAFVERLMQGAQ